MWMRKGIPKWCLEEKSKPPEAEKCARGRSSLNFMPMHPSAAFITKIDLCWLNKQMKVGCFFFILNSGECNEFWAETSHFFLASGKVRLDFKDVQ